jgi:hypothetical protein
LQAAFGKVTTSAGVRLESYALNDYQAKAGFRFGANYQLQNICHLNEAMGKATDFPLYCRIIHTNIRG